MYVNSYCGRVSAGIGIKSKQVRDYGGRNNRTKRRFAKKTFI